MNEVVGGSSLLALSPNTMKFRAQRAQPHNEISVPSLGIEPWLQWWKCQVLTARPPGNSLVTFFSPLVTYSTAASFSRHSLWEKKQV